MSIRAWLYLALALSVLALGGALYAKGWIDCDNHFKAQAAKKTAANVKVKNEIRNRPRDVDAVIKRLRDGTF